MTSPTQPVDDNATQSLQPQSHIESMPLRIDELVIRNTLGRGGFGIVYLAFDSNLKREVAVKVPHRRSDTTTVIADQYFAEAQAIAKLAHPNIIQVYRAACTDAYPCYIVTQYIDGCHLSDWRKKHSPTIAAISKVMAMVAKAVAYAHSQGIVHRDLKPSNILIDQQGKPYVADFGLAIHDSEIRNESAYAGTPAYMSPEQLSSEDHRVDRLSDIYSLGVVIYEMLTGSRPFHGESRADLADKVLHSIPRHPSKLASNIPVELGNVCLKAMSRNGMDRYQSADDLARELERFASDESDIFDESFAAKLTVDLPTQGNRSRANPVVVPRGLRPFERHDSAFYLNLLPGPRDERGMPEQVRFWLNHLSPKLSDNSLKVGVIYGPSGCGKSSLVRAGIIPNLPSDVTAFYMQASGNRTEQQLLERVHSILHQRNCFLPDETDLPQAFMALRRLKGPRTVIFIDQFEQWLFANPNCERLPFVQSLRQCDGQYVQCVLLVREDFWFGLTRLMQAIEILVSENVNVKMVDLFDVQHARSVLAMFGTSYKTITANEDSRTPAENAFLDAAMDYLTTNGRVVCVHLALLADMLKHRPWNTEVGMFKSGNAMEMRFLEQAFEDEHAPRRCRIHAEGALRVLEALLPDVSSRIKGSVKTEQSLLEISRYRDKDSFRDLMTILDGELHLVTPSDRLDIDSVSSENSTERRMSTGYQLTHDFLIAPIRRWVEIHNLSTEEGKARSRLNEYVDLYQSRPNSRYLPTWSEYSKMRRHIPEAGRSTPQQLVMNAAATKYRRRAFTFTGIVFLLGIVVTTITSLIRNQNENVVVVAAIDKLKDASLVDAVELAKQLREQPTAFQLANLVTKRSDFSLDERARLALMLGPSEPKAYEPLIEYLMNANAQDVAAVVPVTSFSEAICERLLNVWTTDASDRHALVAASVLANHPSFNAKLATDADTHRLVSLFARENPAWISNWITCFEPIANPLLPSLIAYVMNEPAQTRSSNIMSLLATYADGDQATIIELMAVANPSEQSILIDMMKPKSSVWIDAMKAAAASEIDRVEANDPNQLWGSPWWVVGDRKLVTLPELSEDHDRKLVELLADQESIHDSSTAMVQHCIEADFTRIVPKLSELGMRLSHIDVYIQDNVKYFNFIAVRDGCEWAYVIEKDAAELKPLQAQYHDSGYLPDDITVCVGNASGPDRYNCIWIKPKEPHVINESGMYVDVEDAKHENLGWWPLMKDGICLVRSNITTRDDDSIYRTSIRWRASNGYESKDDLDRSFEWQRERTRFSQAATLVNMTASPLDTKDTQPLVNPIWWPELPVESHTTVFQSRRDHMREAESLLEQGFKPVSMTIHQIEIDKSPLVSSLWWKGRVDRSVVAKRCNRIRNYSLALHRLGDSKLLEQGMFSEDFPALRGGLIHSCFAYDIAIDQLVELVLDTNRDTRLRRSCAMALTLYDSQKLSTQTLDRLLQQFGQLLEREDDPGICSALLQFTDKLAASNKSQKLAVNKPSTKNQFTTVQGARMIVIEAPEEIMVGSTMDEPGRDHTKERRMAARLGRKYAMGATEVTVEQFLEFSPNQHYVRQYSPTTDCPIINIQYYDMAKYCRWLSEREGYPESEMVYPRIEDIKPGMVVPKDAILRKGYRLPTELEWEFASRGNTHCCGRWFGFDPAGLDYHAWTARNSEYKMHPVAKLLPNDYGLFDMLGNGMEMCHCIVHIHDSLHDEPIVDLGTQETIFDNGKRFISRGGAILYQPLDARAPQRDSHTPDSGRVYLSFRIAKTMQD
jgi:serine/threonine protein kinase/formylglycine-generating enzyme required for sulfatase activity